MTSVPRRSIRQKGNSRQELVTLTNREKDDCKNRAFICKIGLIICNYALGSRSKIHIHLVPENLQAADVILQARAPESAFFPQDFHLGKQLLFLSGGFPQLIGQSCVLRRQLRDESGLIAFRSPCPLILLLQLTPEGFHVALKL